MSSSGGGAAWQKRERPPVCPPAPPRSARPHRSARPPRTAPPARPAPLDQWLHDTQAVVVPLTSWPQPQVCKRVELALTAANRLPAWRSIAR